MKLDKIHIKEVRIDSISQIKDGIIKTRDLIISFEEEFADKNIKRKYLKINVKNDKCEVLNHFNAGDIVDITFCISCVKKTKDDKDSYYQSLILNYIKDSE